MQIREKGGDPRFAAPERDLAHIFPQFISAAAFMFDEHKLDGLVGRVTRQGGTYEEIAQALGAAGKFINLSMAKDPRRTQPEALDECGMYDINPIARDAFFAALGELFWCASFEARRQAYGGDDTVEPLPVMFDTGRKIMERLYARDLEKAQEALDGQV